MILEIVCTSPEECRVAEQNGATQIELCAAIEVGGVTPSSGLIQACRKATTLPIMVMIRPRSGNFVNTEEEREAMQTDIRQYQNLEIQGFVFGCLNKSNEIQTEACQALITAAGDKQKVFHRAFDQTPNAEEAFKQTSNLGFNRILTSGHQTEAIHGITELTNLTTKTGPKILVGGKVRADNADIFVSNGLKNLHLAPFIGPDPEGQIRAIRTTLDKAP